MKKILLSALFLFVTLTSKAAPNEPRYWVNCINKVEAGVMAEIDKPFPFWYFMDGMRGVTFYIDGRRADKPSLPFKLKFTKSTGEREEATITIGKEYERLRCIEYEFTVETYEDSLPAIVYAGCKS